MKVLAITQARTGSSRLPGKVLKTINNQSLLEIHLGRILRSRLIGQLIVATTVEKDDDAIVSVASAMHVPSYRGSVNNVLDRFYQAALPYQPEWVVRLTSDCPLMDPALLDEMIGFTIEKDVDYCSNGLQPSFPDGLDVEVFKFKALEKAWMEASLNSDKEHVTPYIYNNSSFRQKQLFSAANFAYHGANYDQVRLTVDELADFEVIRALVEKLGTACDWKTYADHYLSEDLVKGMNQHITRNEGYTKSLKNNSNPST